MNWLTGKRIADDSFLVNGGHVPNYHRYIFQTVHTTLCISLGISLRRTVTYTVMRTFP